MKWAMAGASIRTVVSFYSGLSMFRTKRSNMNLSPKLQIFIISWAGWHENAATIHDELRAHCDRICIVYSDPDDGFEFGGKIDAIRRSNDLMFGDKFYACLNSFSGDIFLLLHADCHCSDWA